MQVVRRVSKCKQRWLQLLKPNPPILFQYQSPNNYCIKFLQTATQFSSNSQPPQKHCLPHPITSIIDSAKDVEAIYNYIHQFILAEGDEAIVLPGWLLSMAERCTSYYDIKLLIFLLLKHHRLNPDAHLTQEITRACLRSGALLYAKSTMDNSNTFGFTPNKGSALLLLNYAEDHDDVELMNETLDFLEINNIPHDSNIAEIVLRIYRNVDQYHKLMLYARIYFEHGVKLNQSSLEMLMELAVKKGDIVFLRELEEAISKLMNRHTYRSGFAYAKGLLLDGEPEVAAHVIIELLRQHMIRDERDWFNNSKCSIRDDLLAYYKKEYFCWPDELMIEIEKLVKQWPAQMIKLRLSTKKKKERIATFKSCIPKMVEYLSTKGLYLKLDLDHLNELE